MKKFTDFLLFLLTTVCFILLLLPSIFLALKTTHRFRSLAIAMDRYLGVAVQEWLNVLLFKQHIHVYMIGSDFGKTTISSYIGINKNIDNLSIFGEIVDWCLSKLDSNHSINSIGFKNK